MLWGADLLARKEKLGLLADWRHMLVPLMPAAGVLAMLVMAGHDLGTTFIIVIIFLALLWVAGAPGRVFTLMLILMGLVLLLLIVAEPYRLDRITNFLNNSGKRRQRRAPAPAAPASVNWQGCNGKIFLGSGGEFLVSASGRAARSGATCPRTRATSSSRSSAKSLGWSGRSA